MNEFMEQLNALRDAKASNTTNMIDRQDEIMRKQAAIDILTRYRDSWQGEYYKPFRMAIDEVNALPSAEQKKGRWIVLDECTNEGVYCSVCHKKVFKIDYSNTMKWKNFNYCPNCGAKMERSENDA